jgi:hypothetical protein
MSERWVDDLAAQLEDLAARMDWPATPDLADAAATRLAHRRPSRRHRPAKVALIAAAVVVVLATTGLAWPGGRRAVADLLGLRGVHISTGPPPTMATTTPSTPPRLDLGQPTTLAAASARIGFPVRIPTVVGFDHPDGVFVGFPPPEGEVTLSYLPTPSLPASAQTGVGLLLTEFKATMEAGFFAKVAEPGTTIEALAVRGQPAYWLAGAPHAFFYRTADGQIYADTLRLATDTLVWQSGPITLRVEGDISKAQALAIANSLPS